MSQTTGPTGAEAVLEILRNYHLEYIFASSGSEGCEESEELLC
jgi:hypothetical protein